MDAPLSAPDGWDDPPDNEAARKALRFIKACPHVQGEAAKRGLTLGDTWLDWEDRLTRHLFGTVDERGRRVYQTVYAEQPKKAGKSTYLAALMLYLLGPDGEPGGQLYSAAYKKDQAKVVWKIAKAMIEASRSLERKLEVVDYKNELRCPKWGSVYKPITRKAAGQHGFNPSAVAFDELHTQPDRDLWDTIDDSMGARTEPLLFAITNAGHDRQSICYEQREYAIANNRGEFDDPKFLGVVYGAHPEEDDPWAEETWRRANPGLGTTVSVEWMRSKAEQARRVPSKQNAFKRWQLGIWTEQDTRWLTPEMWDDAEREYTEQDLEGQRCYGGLDLGAVSDLTAWVLVFPDADDPERVRVVCRAWCPEDRLWDDTNRYRDRYQVWKREGWLETVPGDAMEYGPVKRQIRADAEQFDLRDIALDTAFERGFGVDLQDELGERVPVVGMKTTYNWMTAPCDELERRLRLEPSKVVHDGNPVLAWAVQNVALRNPDPDRKRPVKDTEDAKIDPVVALLMALDRAMRHEDEGVTVSPYESEDFEGLVL